MKKDLRVALVLLIAGFAAAASPLDKGDNSRHPDRQGPRPPGRPLPNAVLPHQHPHSRGQDLYRCEDVLPLPVSSPTSTTSLRPVNGTRATPRP